MSKRTRTFEEWKALMSRPDVQELTGSATIEDRILQLEFEESAMRSAILRLERIVVRIFCMCMAQFVTNVLILIYLAVLT